MNVHDSTLCNYHKGNPSHGSSLHFSVEETVKTGAIGGEDAVSDRETQDWVPSEGDPPSLQENSTSHMYKSTSNVVFGTHLKVEKYI